MQTTKKLYRSVDDRIIAGVAGGIAHYFNIDPVLVRVVFIVLVLIHGLGIILYLVLLFLVPKQGSETEMMDKLVAFSHRLRKNIEKVKAEKQSKAPEQAAEQNPEQAPAPDLAKSDLAPEITREPFIKDKKRLVGLAIVLVGGFALSNILFHLSWFRWDIFWAVGIIIVGFYLMIRKA